MSIHIDETPLFCSESWCTISYLYVVFLRPNIEEVDRVGVRKLCCRSSTPIEYSNLITTRWIGNTYLETDWFYQVRDFLALLLPLFPLSQHVCSPRSADKLFQMLEEGKFQGSARCEIPYQRLHWLSESFCWECGKKSQIRQHIMILLLLVSSIYLLYGIEAYL